MRDQNFSIPKLFMNQLGQIRYRWKGIDLTKTMASFKIEFDKNLMAKNPF
jgi:hypothetical protein